MRRYIDADEFADFIKRWGQGSSLEDVIEWLETGDTEDVVEVVRCKDCRWYEINELKSDGTEDKRYKPSMCVLHSRSFRDNYYCADGERAKA